MKQDVTMSLVRETKGAVLYEENNWQNRPDYLIGRLYLRKNALTTKGITVFPQTITITVEVK